MSDAQRMSLALRPSFSADLDCPSRIVLERLFARLGAGPHQPRRTRTFGGSPWALGASAATALVMLGLWWISQVGQRLARGQMEALRADLEGAIAVCAPAETAPVVAAAPALS